MKEEEAALGRVWEAVRASHQPAESRSRAQGGCEQSSEDPRKAAARTKVEVDITSGYFGLYKKYKQWIIDSPALTRVIAASPEASLPLTQKALQHYS